MCGTYPNVLGDFILVDSDIRQPLSGCICFQMNQKAIIIMLCKQSYRISEIMGKYHGEYINSLRFKRGLMREHSTDLLRWYKRLVTIMVG